LTDEQKFPYKDQLAYCEKSFNESHSSTAIARFMAENASEFGKDVEFSFERKIAAPMNKMMIGRLGSRVQRTLDSFFR
jgi:hypothetical protein